MLHSDTVRCSVLQFVKSALQCNKCDIDFHHTPLLNHNCLQLRCCSTLSVLQYMLQCNILYTHSPNPRPKPRLFVSDLLQCVAVCCSVLQCATMCCSVLQCVAVCDNVLQCIAVYCSVLQCAAVCCGVLQCVAPCCCVLQCVTVCCSVLQCVAVCQTQVRCSIVYTYINIYIHIYIYIHTTPCLNPSNLPTHTIHLIPSKFAPKL